MVVCDGWIDSYRVRLCGGAAMESCVGYDVGNDGEVGFVGDGGLSEDDSCGRLRLD